MQGQKSCLICRSPYVEKHHVFGAANRQNSEKYGLTVWLCHKHHNEPPEGVHFNRRFMDELHEWGQKQFETYYPAVRCGACGIATRSIHTSRNSAD